MVGPMREIVTQRVCAYGSVLIQSDAHKVPHLFNVNLPRDVAARRCFVLDPILGSGQTASMAVRVLTDHGVPESQITFVSLFAAAQGVALLVAQFPHIHIVLSSLDDELNRRGWLVPGIGNFADRFFGSERSSATAKHSNENNELPPHVDFSKKNIDL